MLSNELGCPPCVCVPLTALFCFWFAHHVSSMAASSSSDDSEGSLTPVDFIQLQHYMECMSLPLRHPRLISVHCVSWEKKVTLFLSQTEVHRYNNDDPPTFDCS